MRIRIKFRKYGVMKFVGHLDMMRYFQKSMRRANIAIAYSEGYSPHQIMSFAAPLGVGITSDGEYLDIEVTETMPSEEAIAALNQAMVEGVEVISYRKLKDTDTTAMAAVAAADYTLTIKEGYLVPAVSWEEALCHYFIEPKEILVTKKTKKSEKVMDLKQLVYDFKITIDQGRPVFYLKVCTGSTDNVKPELVLESFYQSLGLTLEPFSIQIHRKDVYGVIKDERISLGEMGEKIE